jgi:hypothetical protein
MNALAKAGVFGENGTASESGDPLQHLSEAEG